MSFLKNFFVEEDGQSMIEYGLVIAGVVALGVAVLATFSTSVKTAFTSVEASIAAAF